MKTSKSMLMALLVMVVSLMLAGCNITLPPAPTIPATPASPDPLAGTAWQLQSILMMDDTLLIPEESGSYRLEFLADGEMAGQIDCNLVGGSYTVDGALLSFDQMRMTLVACPESIVTDRFLQGLNDANSYVLQDGLLNIAFGPDSGILVMEPVE